MGVTIEKVWNLKVWNLMDEVVEMGLGPSLLGVLKQLIALDPEGAARRASGQPQYDHGRATANGGEHERTPDGGGDQPQPHPEQFALANDCS